ncbi:MAG: hypothetical protein ACOX8H_12255 [Ruminococcus sp.]|jgi:ribosomal protein L11 methylase PrmA
MLDYEELIEEVTRRVLQYLGQQRQWEKKVITEKDMARAWRQNMTVVRLRKGQLITDLARDFARARGIQIEEFSKEERPGEGG